MRILLTGASGLVGRSVTAGLQKAGHQVIAVTRSGSNGRQLDGRHSIALDIGRATTPETWLPFLQGVDAVVNCAGLLQDSPGNSVRAVHVDGIAALFAACEQARVRRVVHVSAIGVNREQPSTFSKTKLEGDQALMARDLDWVILRPSVIVGRPAYGGSALFRGLAALPILPVMPGTGLLQIVQLDEVVQTIVFFVRPEAPTRIALDLAGPERLSFTDVVLAYRRWLDRRKPSLLNLPPWANKFAFRMGDLLGMLGWRPPIRSTAASEMTRGAVGDPAEWQRSTGIRSTSLGASLAAEPAGVQEQWFASLYFLKAFGLIVFSLFWIATGIISLGPGWERGKALLFEGGVGEPLATLGVVGGAFADMLIGIGIAWRRTARLALLAALVISLVYAVIGTILVPQLWSDPLGPMLKIWPIIAFNLMLLAVLRDR
jgi:uncharacterized protein YbjT (DUF2867 family)